MKRLSKKSLELMIHKDIPLSKRMGLKVKSSNLSRGVFFSLPLKPNKNHKKTAFGGTLVAAQALACWSHIMVLLSHSKLEAEVVLQRQNAEFMAPVKKDFFVRSLPISPSAVKLFLKTLSRHNKARLPMKAEVTINGKKASTFYGEYVAIKNS